VTVAADPESRADADDPGGVGECGVVTVLEHAGIHEQIGVEVGWKRWGDEDGDATIPWPIREILRCRQGSLYAVHHGAAVLHSASERDRAAHAPGIGPLRDHQAKAGAEKVPG